jgi:hypothetical protein
MASMMGKHPVMMKAPGAKKMGKPTIKKKPRVKG